MMDAPSTHRHRFLGSVRKKMVRHLVVFFVGTFLLVSLPSHSLDSGVRQGAGQGGDATFGDAPAASPSSSPSDEPDPCDFENEKQYKAYLVIQRFKRTITGDPFGITDSWVGPGVCDYKGFSCDPPPNDPDTPTIATVDFNGYQLEAPTVEGFVDELPDLAFFHANTNNFSGSVPDLSGLPFIYELDFSNNKISGAFPISTVSVKQLLFLDLRYNFLCGCVPPSVFNVELAVLFLNNNGFEGRIPSNLGSTTAKYLTLANNRFTGPIPNSIGQAKDTLVEVVFLNNKLSGCLPYEIGFLYKATVFDAGGNFLSGKIPHSFGCLGKVEQLNLAGNLLFGEVPEVVCKLPNLRNLSLSDNYFTSLGPSCHALIKKRVLKVSNNCIPGLPNQRSPEDCAKFSCSPKSCPVTPKLYDIPCKTPSCGGKPYTPPPKRRAGRSVVSFPSYTAVHKPKS